MPGFNPFSVLASKIYGAVAIAALVVAGAQTLRIEGVKCRDAAAGEYSRCLLTGFRQDVADRELTIERLKVDVFNERAAHQQTKFNYRAAQEEAAALDAANLARVRGEQQEIIDEVTADFQHRIAAARAAASERMRVNAGARPGTDPARSGGEQPMPVAGGAASGADGPTAHLGLSDRERLVATEQAIQLDALITFVERQLGVEVSR